MIAFVVTITIGATTFVKVEGTAKFLFQTRRSSMDVAVQKIPENLKVYLDEIATRLWDRRAAVMVGQDSVETLMRHSRHGISWEMF